MHYQNGRPAKVGDIVTTKDTYNIQITGIVLKTCGENDCCNLVIMPVDRTRIVGFKSKNCIHSDDVVAAPFAAPDAIPAPDAAPDAEPIVPIAG